MKTSAMQIMNFPGKYIQGNGALAELPGIVKRLGGRPLALTTKSMVSTAQRILAAPVDSESIPAATDRAERTRAEYDQIVQFNGECSEKEISRVMQLAESCQATVMVAIGGGKSIDCCKIAADRLGLPVVAAPTIASTDAPCSGCAVVYTDQGVFDYVYYQKHNPDVVLVDTSIIAKAPARFLISGMGDGMATYFEANSCHRSGCLNECGGMRTITGLAIARLCMDTIFKFGRQAIRDLSNGLVSEAVEAIIEANTLLSGIGFESCGVAFAHGLHNGLTVLPATHSLYHGEKVAFGVVTGLQLYDELGLADQVYDFFIDVGLPVCFEDLGLKDITEEQISAVANSCCESGSLLYHEPYSFDSPRVARAMKEADARGQDRKGSRSGPRVD